MNILEQQLNDAFVELEVSERQQASIQIYLQLLKNKDLATYNHSLRVGLKSLEVSNMFGVDQKILFYAGLLHDVGKSLTDRNTLQKTIGFDGKDMDEISKHPKDGYRLLTGIHDFTAEIIVRHHRYSSRCYPKKLPITKIDLSKASEVMVGYYSRLLSLIDFYDAISHRKNDKFSEGEEKVMEATKKKKTILDSHGDLRCLIERLYEAKIFS